MAFAPFDTQTMKLPQTKKLVQTRKLPQTMKLLLRVTFLFTSEIMTLLQFADR